MSVQINNKSVKLLMGKSQRTLSVMLDQEERHTEESGKSLDFFRALRHVLQKPDVSKSQLKKWLGRNVQRDSEQANKRKWGHFMQHYVKSNANENG